MLYDAPAETQNMRTTLTIDDDILLAVKAQADREKRSIGEVLSGLARRALEQPTGPNTKNGLVLLPRPKTGKIVTLQVVNELRDDMS
jgi:hypothetical protein